jgi:predicted ATPase
MRTYSIDTTALRNLQEPDSGISLRRDGGNAASVLRELKRKSKRDVDRVSELLESIVPGMKGLGTKQLGNKLTLRFTQEWEKDRRLDFYAFSMSDGTLRAVGLLLAVFQKPTPALVVIEEPEATIHPGGLGTLLDVLRLAAKRTQVLVTTHSPDVLDAEWIEDRHIRVVEWHMGATRVSSLAASSREALKERLMTAGELLRANALDPEPAVEGGHAAPIGE